MSRTVATAAISDPVRLPEKFGPASVKAGLPSDQTGQTIGSVACDALIAYCGTVKAAAITLGNCDPSLMQRELKAGDFRRLNRCEDIGARAAVSEALDRAFGKLVSEEQYADRLIDRAYDIFSELRQYVAAKRTA